MLFSRLHTNTKTFLGRYWPEINLLREFAPKDGDLKLLSFGCSTGEELVTAKAIFPKMQLFGCDVEDRCLRSAQELAGGFAVVMPSDTELLARHGPYDVILCNSVLMRPTTVVNGRKQGIDPGQWIDVLNFIDSNLKPGGLLQIINSNVPFRLHPRYGQYAALPNPAMYSPNFVDMFDLDGRHLCTGSAGVGWSAIAGYHLAEEGAAHLQPADLGNIHFWKAAPGRLPPSPADEVGDQGGDGRLWAAGRMSYRPQLPADETRAASFVEMDVAWQAVTVDRLEVRRTARRIWFDGTVAAESSTCVAIGDPAGTAFIEAALGRPSTRFGIERAFADMDMAVSAIRAPSF